MKPKKKIPKLGNKFFSGMNECKVNVEKRRPPLWDRQNKDSRDLGLHSNSMLVRKVLVSPAEKLIRGLN
jgi:hypothetical protein